MTKSSVFGSLDDQRTRTFAVKRIDPYTNYVYCYNKLMRTFVVYREQSDHARAVETFMHDFTRQTGKVLETVDPDTPEGAHMRATHDIVELPSVVVLDDNGIIQTLWRGLPLPTISEVSYYAD